jgi:hypothetical protein
MSSEGLQKLNNLVDKIAKRTEEVVGTMEHNIEDRLSQLEQQMGMLNQRLAVIESSMLGDVRPAQSGKRQTRQARQSSQRGNGGGTEKASSAEKIPTNSMLYCKEQIKNSEDYRKYLEESKEFGDIFKEAREEANADPETSWTKHVAELHSAFWKKLTNEQKKMIKSDFNEYKEEIKRKAATEGLKADTADPT